MTYSVACHGGDAPPGIAKYGEIWLIPVLL